MNAVPSRGVKRTALQRAAETGDFEIMEYLVNFGTEIDAPPPGRGGGTALQFASVHGYTGIVSLFLREGTSSNI